MCRRTACVKAFDLSSPANLSRTYFLKLYLHDASGKLVSDNFYWLSTKLDTLDWSKQRDTVYTPQKEFADLTGLNSMPRVKLELNSSPVQSGEKGTITVKVKNPSEGIAFQVHLRATKGKEGDDIVPIFWDDNYFSLLPGEEKSVTATYDLKDAGSKPPVLELDGYNIAPATVQLTDSNASESIPGRGTALLCPRCATSRNLEAS